MTEAFCINCSFEALKRWKWFDVGEVLLTLGLSQLAAHHFTIMWASVGNTLPATFWATYDLVAHPEALQVVRQEILDTLRSSGVEFSHSRDVMLSKEQLDKLVFLGTF